MGGISRLAEDLSASQEGLSSLESDSYEQLITHQNITITCETSFTVPPTWTVKNAHRLKYSWVVSFIFQHTLCNSLIWQKKCWLCPHRRAERESCKFPSVTDYVQLQNCTPNHITLLPNDHAQEVASFGVGRTQHVYYTQAIASTYMLIRAYCTYCNKAGYVHKVQPQLDVVLQIPA
jgi:hypothetical protein